MQYLKLKLSYASMVTTLCLLPAERVVAQQATAPPTIVAQCATCHGNQGISTAPNTPHLAGQVESYLIEQLNNYRTGKRQHVIMGVMAQQLTDEQIADSARWYANVKVELKKE